jgi:hypothetical protein
MSRTKKTSKRGRVKNALPAFGVAGVSLVIAGGASAATPVTATDTQSQNTSSRHEIFLGEEEISDVSLSTFYVFDREGAAKPQLGEKVAWGAAAAMPLGAHPGEAATTARRASPLTQLTEANGQGRVSLDPALFYLFLLRCAPLK